MVRVIERQDRGKNCPAAIFTPRQPDVSKRPQFILPRGAIYKPACVQLINNPCFAIHQVFALLIQFAPRQTPFEGFFWGGGGGGLKDSFRVHTFWIGFSGAITECPEKHVREFFG